MDFKKLIAITLSTSALLGTSGITEIPARPLITGITAIAADTSELTGKCGENAVYTLDKDGTLTISGTGDMDLSMWDSSKESIENRTIKKIVVSSGIISICSFAFSDFKDVTEVSLGDTIENIEEYAFESLEGIRKIEIPSSVKTIGDCAFRDCISLEYIIIPQSVTEFGGFAFQNTPWLEKQREKNPLLIINGILIDAAAATGNVVIPNKVTRINPSAFFNSKADSVTIPNSVKSIGHSAFESSTLKTLDIPESVTSIETRAFSCMDELTEITIHGTVKKIDEQLFRACKQLKKVTLSEGIESIGNGSFFDCSKLETVILPESLTSIEQYAFYYCTSLSEIKLPKKLKTISGCAFFGCESLTEITIPESVTSLECDSFQYCPKLENITFMGKKCEIADFDSTISNTDSIPPEKSDYSGTITGYANSTAEAYAKKYNRKFVAMEEECIGSGQITGDISYTITKDGLMVISGQGDLPDVKNSYDIPWANRTIAIKHIVIGNGITSIGAMEFIDCYNLESITISDTVQKIGSHAFLGCKKLKTIQIPPSVKEIGDSAFMDTPWLAEQEKDNQFVIINNILISGSNADGKVVIPEKIHTIAGHAFSENEKITSVIFSDSVKRIDDFAFSYCTKLEAAELSDSVKSIGIGAFAGCCLLSDITFTDSIEEIENGAFDYTLWIENERRLNPYVVVKNFLVDAQYVEGEAVVPDGVKVICGGAFIGALITKVTMPDSVIKIGGAAFSNCEELENVEFSPNLEVIDHDAFFNCTSLCDVKFPETLKYIGHTAFQTCSMIDKVYIPKSVETIGKKAFYDCEALEEITIAPDKCDIYDNASTFSNSFSQEAEYTAESCPLTAVIRGNAGSDAEIYANRYGRTFKALETSSKIVYGDANLDGNVSVADAVAIMQFLGNKDKYALTDEAKANADCYNTGDGITGNDALTIQKIDSGLIKVTDLPVIIKDNK